MESNEGIGPKSRKEHLGNKFYGKYHEFSSFLCYRRLHGENGRHGRNGPNVPRVAAVEYRSNNDDADGNRAREDLGIQNTKSAILR
ncbi:hypothetical protein V1477_009133 [Vespula maculifrons]|uniref:Uncharacterized protein n=1 Tax=Vespula maculifrons TaxID=7453 RepID=A0ABD2CBW4_VESMC